MGGGGGSSDVDFRKFKHELPQIGQGYQFQQNQLNDYINNNPLVGAANQGALNFWGQLPSLTAPNQALLNQLPSQFAGLQGQLSNLYGQGQGLFGNLGNIASGIGALQNQGQGVFSNLGNISGQLGDISGQIGNLNNPLNRLMTQSQGLFGQSGNLYDRLGRTADTFNPLIARSRQLEFPLRDAYQGQIAGVLRSGGALTPQLARDVAQQSRQLESELGTAHTTGGLGRELLNRDAAREARFKDYLGMGQTTAGALSSLLGQQAGMRNAQAGVLGQQGNVLGLRSGILGQQGQLVGARAGLLGQQANIAGQQAGIAGQQGGILGLLGNLFGQQAGVTGQQGGILSLLGNITGQQSGLIGSQAGLTQGLTSGIQNLQTGGLNQLLGAQGSNVSGFTGLTNPMLGYLGNLFGGNLQASTQNAVASQNANAGKAGGAISGAGSIISTVLPIALAAFSDERLKQKIRGTGMKTKEGVPMKTFSYKANPGVTFLGVLSKDVKKKVPSAVTREPLSGYEMVDTSRFPIVQLSATKRKAA